MNYRTRAAHNFRKILEFKQYNVLQKYWQKLISMKNLANALYYSVLSYKIDLCFNDCNLDLAIETNENGHSNTY